VGAGRTPARRPRARVPEQHATRRRRASVSRARGGHR
jgi:hypothetical protein